MKTRSYSELLNLETFLDRFEYLKLGGIVGRSTFGYDRHINQGFYRSSAWKRVRQLVIIRDNGCDLGCFGYEIASDLLVHHINPVIVNDIVDQEEWILDPRYLITTTKDTHNAIHYGDVSLLPMPPVQRQFGDTKLW